METVLILKTVGSHPARSAQINQPEQRKRGRKGEEVEVLGNHSKEGVSSAREDRADAKKFRNNAPLAMIPPQGSLPRKGSKYSRVIQESRFNLNYTPGRTSGASLGRPSRAGRIGLASSPAGIRDARRTLT